MAEDKKIGKILLEEGMITEEQLAQALEKQVKTSEALGFILVGFNFITEDVLYHFLAMQENLRFVDVTTISLEEEVTKIINRKTALKYNIIPIEKKPGKIVFATSDLLNSALKANLKYELGLEAEYDFAFVGTTVSALLSAIDK